MPEIPRADPAASGFARRPSNGDDLGRSAGGLPRSRSEFCRELLRRLRLLDREIRALEGAAIPASDPGSAERLELLRLTLVRRLGATSENDWSEARGELIALWRCYRGEFETLAAASRGCFPARLGRRERGPRW